MPIFQERIGFCFRRQTVIQDSLQVGADNVLDARDDGKVDTFAERE
jgi:hypothetical protein